VALLEVAPRIEDGDDRLAFRVVGRVSHLPETAAVSETAEIVGREPAL
jgi:hypothetical protein